MSPSARHIYPYGALLLAIAGSVVLWLGGSRLSSTEIDRIQQSAANAADLIRLRGEVLRLDEVLTMSAKMAVATGNTVWVNRYDLAETELDSVLSDLQARGISLDTVAAGAQTQLANDALVAIERCALDKVAAGQTAEAQAMMDSAEYTELKAVYSDGMAQLLTQLTQKEYGTRDRAQQLQRQLAVVEILITVGLLLLWLNFARHRHRYHRVQVKARSALKNDLIETTSRFRTVIDHAPVVIFAVDPDGQFEYSDGAGLANLNLQPGEVVGQSVWAVYADHPDVVDSLKRCLRGEPQTFVAYVQNHWFRTVAIPVKRGTQYAAVGVSTDITSEVLAQRDTARFMAAIDHSAVGLAMLDQDGRIEHSSSAFCRLTGCSRDELTAKPLAELIPSTTARDALLAALATREVGAIALDELPIQSESRVTPVRAHISTVSMSDGLHHLVATHDLTDERMLRAALDRARRVDAATGLPNRAALLEKLKADGHLRHRLYYIDLDHFHRVNQALDASQSERLLRELGNRLAEFVHGDSAVFRVGGDEFVLYQQAPDFDDNTHIADHLREAIAQDISLDDRRLNITASIGITDSLPGQGETPEGALQQAESAMYAAKRAGRNRVHVFQASMKSQSTRALQVEARLREALKTQALEVHYQPVVRLADDKPCSAEALLRWTDGELGTISPGEFVPIAEQLGLAGELGQYVFARACRDLREWNQQLDEPLTVALNCAADQLEASDFIDSLTDCRTRCGISAQQFELEITERVLVAPSKQVTANLDALKQHGFRVALDDFGTGYSALSYLRNFSLDTLKLDHSFVSDIDHPATRKLCQAIVSMGDALDMKTVAEGVETAEQAQTLRRMGYAMVQGFFYTPALPPADFLQWVKARLSCETS